MQYLEILSVTLTAELRISGRLMAHELVTNMEGSVFAEFEVLSQH
jgi:hypothetical protein